jgi:hypothetical protein
LRELLSFYNDINDLDPIFGLFRRELLSFYNDINDLEGKKLNLDSEANLNDKCLAFIKTFTPKKPP